ncbi:MAG: preprotein translocase subunit YajC [Lentisphaerae bacterium]|nr:preprotein translocase subunit YajC [Lentisphaerota bacterium]
MPTALAMMGPAPGGGQGGQSPMMLIGWLVIMVALFYFMLIRPQQRKEKERKALMEGIKSGDRVIFSGGIVGTVTNVKDKTLAVKVADNTKIEVLRGAVNRILQKDEELTSDI